MVAFSSAFACLAQSQIVDDEASKNFLAVHCAVSGSRNANDYEHYGRQLAKTLNLLTPKQQVAVFGFLPRPGVASIPDYNPDLHGPLGMGLAEGRNDGEENGTANPLSGSTNGDESGSSNPVVDAVGRFNDSINGTNTTAGAVIAGTAPDSGTPTQTENEGQSVESEKSGESWIDGVLGWLRGLGADQLADKVEGDVNQAQQSGILDENGTLNRNENGDVIDGEGNIVFPSSGNGSESVGSFWNPFR